MTINASSRAISIVPSPDGSLYSQYLDGGSPDAWRLDAGHWIPSKMSMRLIHPATSTTSTYVYENWYTGMALDLPICVQGGAWPFLYQLTTAPSGMTVGEKYGDANYGRITWASPTAGTHTVAIRVTDQDGNFVTKSWTLTVGTSKHVFFNASTGNNSTGDGSIGNPYQNFSKWSSVDNATNALNGKIAVYRTGTYATNTTDALTSNSYRWIINGTKPLVHMAYPGESVVFDFSDALWWFQGANEMAILGVEFQGIGGNVGPSYVKAENSSRVLLDSNNYTLTGGSAYSTGDNPGVVMSIDSTLNSDWALTNSEWNGINGYNLFLAYDLQYGLIEGNTVANCSGGLGQAGFYIKLGDTNITIRNNTAISGNTGELIRIDNYTAVTNVEACYNNLKTDYYCVFLGQENQTSTGRWIYRNTMQAAATKAGVIVSYSGATGVVLENNVITHDGTYTNGVRQANGHTGTITQTNQLAAANTAYVTAATGALAGAYIAANRGTHGWEVA